MDNIHQPGHYTYRGIECKEVQKIMTSGLSTRRCITPGNLILLSMQDLSSRGRGLLYLVRQKEIEKYASTEDLMKAEDDSDMKTIKRKSMLYQTGVEYGDYTMNHVQGCAHGCKYPCYAFLMKKRFGQIKDYESWLEPVLVSNTLELLDKEIPKLRDKIQSVQLCFTTDPFMEGYPEVSQMSIAAIRKLNEAGIKCTTLTKGLLPIELAELSPENEYGITLITLNEAYREQMEPGAAPCSERLAALKALHEAGCKTWVSIEPYPTPNMIEQNLHQLLEAVSFTGRIIFGRTNYSKIANAYKGHKHFYNECAAEVISFCLEHGIDYHIKEKTITKE